MDNKIRILLVDDEVHLLESLTRVLAIKKIAVKTARDGREALDILGREQFDVIVLDVRMPVMDGIAALREIRQTDVLTPVLLLTGHADLNCVTEAMRSGGTDYLLKPCNVDELVSAIENAFERKTIGMEVAEKTDKKRQRRRDKR
jgi:DNA-binding NtrC family response regulator